MKAAALLSLTIFALVPLTACAANNDFDTVVSAVEQHYSVHVQRIPMMGFISLFARASSSGGVRSMRVAEFDHFDNARAADLQLLVASALGPDWQPFVTERGANGSVSLIYVRPDDPAMRMLIADYSNGELEVVRLDLNGDRLKHWMKDPEQSARNHNPE